MKSGQVLCSRTSTETRQPDCSSLTAVRSVHRRDLFRLGVGRVFISGLALAVSDLLGSEAISWGPSVKGLRLGIRLQVSGVNSLVVVYVHNTDVVRKRVFVSLGMVKRINFVALSPDGKEYPIKQRAEYTPCAGLCYCPLIEELDPGRTQQLEFATKDLIHVPERAPITELGTLLSRGCSIRASFAVSDKDLQEALNQEFVEGSWRGRIVSPQVRVR